MSSRRDLLGHEPCRHGPTALSRTGLVGCSKRPDFSPAQPWRAETRHSAGKAAGNFSFPQRFTFHASRFTVLESDARTPLAGFFNSLLGLFDLDDRLALIRSAIQAGIMRQLDLVALRTDGHARRCDAQLLCAPFVASFPGMFMFRIWHGNSFSLSIAVGHAMMLTVRRSCGS